MSVGKLSILALYKRLLRESTKFSPYNFRMYALRRVRDAFKENRDLSDSHVIDAKIQYGNKSLDIIRRQAIIGHLYSTEKLVIESKHD